MASYRIDEAISGSWFDPAQSGQGFVVHPIRVGGALHLTAAWYTYDHGQPMWLFGSGAVDGDRARLSLYSATGADFPPRFTAGSVQIAAFGELELQFDSAARGQASWTTSRPGFASGNMPITRLGPSIGADGRSGADGIAACHIGSWYNASQSGHGISPDIYQVGNQRILALVWYAFVDGQPIWLTGTATINGDHADLPMIRTEGPGFGSDFDPADMQRIPIGNLRFTTTDATHAQLAWQFSEPRLGSGQLDVVQFARAIGRECGVPAP